MANLDVNYTLGNMMFTAYIEYINSRNEISRKDIGKINDVNDIANTVFGDDYILEYMYMPQAILVVKSGKIIVVKYEIKKIENKLVLIAR